MKFKVSKGLNIPIGGNANPEIKNSSNQKLAQVLEWKFLDEEDERVCCALIAASSSKASLSTFSDGLLSLTNIHPHIYETFVIFEYAGWNRANSSVFAILDCSRNSRMWRWMKFHMLGNLALLYLVLAWF